MKPAVPTSMKSSRASLSTLSVDEREKAVRISAQHFVVRALMPSSDSRREDIHEALENWRLSDILQALDLARCVESELSGILAALLAGGNLTVGGGAHSRRPFRD